MNAFHRLGYELLPPPTGRSPSLEEGGLGVSPVKACGLAVDWIYGLCGRPYNPSRVLSKGCCYNVGDERARNARPYGVRRCSRRLQTHLTVAMMQPSVANASHRCDFCHVVGARIARPSIFRKLSIFPSHTSLLEGGGPPRGRWKEFSGAGRRSSPLLLCRTSFYFPTHVRHTRHKKHMKHTRNRS